MKRIFKLNLLTALLLLMVAAPAAAQVQLDEKAFCGKWGTTMQGVKFRLTFGKDHSFEQRTDVPLPNNMGTIHVTAPGTWRADSNTVALKVDGEKVALKVDVSDAQIRQMIEQQIAANRDQMMQWVGGNEILMRDVIVADDLLLFSQEIPNPMNPEKKQLQKMTMTREK